MQAALKTEMREMMIMIMMIIMMIMNDDKNQVVDAVQAALKTEMREIKKIQQALRQLADEVYFVDDYD